jgi:hypothetical protein
MLAAPRGLGSIRVPGDGLSDIWSAALRAALVTSSRTLIQSGGHRRTPNQIGHFASAKQVCGRFRVERLEVFGAAIDAAQGEWDCPT